MFAFAQDVGLVTVNPANSPRARGRKQGHRRARGTELSPVQVKRFLDECSPRWRLFFTVALDTGLRRGELIGLRWGDIDLLERILYVRRSIGPYDEPGGIDAFGELSELLARDEERLTTKTEASQRLVPILDGAQGALEELFAGAQDTRDQAPVFATVERKCGRDGVMRATGRPLSPRMVTRVFRRYADRAGLPPTIRLHDLRHTAITSAIGQGEDILLVAAFAGHAKTSTTVDVYGHLMPDRVREAARRMRSVSGSSSPAESPTTAPLEPSAIFARRVDSTSPWRPGGQGRGATVTMRLEHSATPRKYPAEPRQTDHGQHLTSIQRDANTRARARLLADWDAHTKPKPPHNTQPAHADPSDLVSMLVRLGIRPA